MHSLKKYFVIAHVLFCAVLLTFSQLNALCVKGYLTIEVKKINNMYQTLHDVSKENEVVVRRYNEYTKKSNLRKSVYVEYEVPKNKLINVMYEIEKLGEVKSRKYDEGQRTNNELVLKKQTLENRKSQLKELISSSSPSAYTITKLNDEIEHRESDIIALENSSNAGDSLKAILNIQIEEKGYDEDDNISVFLSKYNYLLLITLFAIAFIFIGIGTEKISLKLKSNSK